MKFKYDTIWLEIEQQRAHDQSNCLTVKRFHWPENDFQQE